MVLDTVQHPLLTHGVLGGPAQLPHDDLGGGRHLGDTAAPTRDQLLQILSWSFTVWADED